MEGISEDKAGNQESVSSAPALSWPGFAYRQEKDRFRAMWLVMANGEKSLGSLYVS